MNKINQKGKKSSRTNVPTDWKDFALCLMLIHTICLAIEFPAFVRFKSDEILYLICMA